VLLIDQGPQEVPVVRCLLQFLYCQPVLGSQRIQPDQAIPWVLLDLETLKLQHFQQVLGFLGLLRVLKALLVPQDRRGLVVLDFPDVLDFLDCQQVH
jgi:hypothetical protein